MLARVLFIIVILEAVAQLVAPNFSIRELIELDGDTYVLRQNARVAFSGFYEKLPRPVTWDTNARRMRGGEPPPPSGKRRIATFGDSEVFGWSVESAQTFQKQMEALDDEVEVLNFGVPGYNAPNIAEAVARVVRDDQPSLCFYLVNPNDADPPPRVSKWLHYLSYSALLRLFQYSYYVFIEGPMEARAREQPAARRQFAADLRQIAEACSPLVFGFLRWSDHGSAPEGARVINLEPVVAGLPRIDHHLDASGHLALAKFFLTALR